MSTLEADLIQPATGTNTSLKLKARGNSSVKIGDGELAFPDADGSANQIIKTDGSGNLSFIAQPGGGKILQVTSGGTTTQTDTTSSSYADVVGMNVAITPSATSSSVLVLVSINVTATSAAAVGEFQLYRTTGGVVANLNVWSQVNHVEHQSGNHFLMQYDTGISTTSATNYYLRFFRTDQSGTLTVNRNDGSDIARSDMTLIEVGA